ncbi:DNA adenine methylase [Succinivibrio dextrinosolvens]|uniref:site-specific DNA-methyltransferase (adenine-specific) n=1 Tax=Succinivibrio dextrinosolvens TaxID=83771 RepID=A0A662Z8Q6_9GAMM|nr:DNA adenine methylase [Succinivibrio dextrinosolvens]SFJ84503.1 DNA adenine methylase [Succinivibrio dextrinosolvens]
MIQPVLKWVGGKRQILNSIAPLVPKSFTSYCEPFFGGGAVCFHLKPNHAIINDINTELIEFYKVVRDYPDDLISELLTYVNDEAFYYSIRDLDRTDSFKTLSPVKKAARTYYLNRMGFNGLYRVNSKGLFNVPYGKYKRPFTPFVDSIRELSDYFNSNNIVFLNGHYSEILNYLESKSFVYLDPPYDRVSTTSFISYSSDSFSRLDQIGLKNFCDKLTANGIRFMLSNSATDFIKDLYKDYKITIVGAKRYINCDAKNRGSVDEVIVRNYK